MADGEGQDPITANNDAGQVEPATKPEQDSGLTVTDYEKMVAELRQENARRRTENKEFKAKADKFDELERQNMSEVEKLNAELADLRAETAKAHEDAKRAKLEALGVPPETVSLINIDSLDFSNPNQLKESLSHLIKPPTRKAETPPADGKRQETAWTADKLATASREEILENIDQINASISNGKNKNRL